MNCQTAWTAWDREVAKAKRSVYGPAMTKTMACIHGRNDNWHWSNKHGDINYSKYVCGCGLSDGQTVVVKPLATR